MVKQTEGFSYEDLAFHILDSRCYRHFCRIGFADEGVKKSALCAAIKAISPQTWKAINDILMAYAQDRELEGFDEAGQDLQVSIEVDGIDLNGRAPQFSNAWVSVLVVAIMVDHRVRCGNVFPHETHQFLPHIGPVCAGCDKEGDPAPPDAGRFQGSEKRGENHPIGNRPGDV
jgi:hypothetical protein